jgi:hypothetical protein
MTSIRFYLIVAVLMIIVAPISALESDVSQIIPTEFAVAEQVSIAEYLTFNQQVAGLSPNWQRYTASLNWADYSSPTLSDQITGLSPNWHRYTASLNWADYSTITANNKTMAEHFTLNQQATGLSPNWQRYTASLNWADYVNNDLPPSLPVHSDDMNKRF